MDNKENLKDFFEAENHREWEKYRLFLHPDVRWSLHSTEEHTVCGIDAYMTAIIDAYAGNNNTFRCEKLYLSKNGNRIATILINNENERSCDIFEFKDGLIYREYEFIL